MIKKGSISLIIYDFDGVMTDNRVLVDENGREGVFVHRGDGYAISKIKEAGIEQIIISTEQNEIVKKRAQKLSIPVIFGVKDKGTVVNDYCKTHKIDLKNVLYVGNDLNDKSAMDLVGYICVPADAESEVIQMATWISKKKGGYGVIRELYSMLFFTEEND